MTTQPTEQPAATLEAPSDASGGGTLSGALGSDLVTGAPVMPSAPGGRGGAGGVGGVGGVGGPGAEGTGADAPDPEDVADLPAGSAGADEGAPASTGTAEVDAALSRLAELGGLPVDQHPDRFDRVAADLHEVLADAAPAGDGR